ncbi:MAG TPA: NADH-quinone oxidoreductase subunit C [Gammaproteobacteria bacterium]|nr:NADH-quinone oxidoreductase subunit C [Gammaproteobacteria bacterium]
MPLPVTELQARLEQCFAGQYTQLILATGQLTMELPRAQFSTVCQRLRDDPQFAFTQMMDLCGVDYAAFGSSDWETNNATTSGFSRGVSDDPDVQTTPRRYAVVYQLLSLEHNQRLRLRVFAEGEPPTVDTVTAIWNSADWFEREAFDLFGILFEGHPDLRRLLTDYGFIGHPFRKDFPLEGHVEVRYDPEKGRVVYQPVTIQNRVLVPRVIRKDDRFDAARNKSAKN